MCGKEEVYQSLSLVEECNLMSDTPTCSQCHKPMNLLYIFPNTDKKTASEMYYCRDCKNTWDITRTRVLSYYNTIKE